jgi:O-antigen ligase
MRRGPIKLVCMTVMVVGLTLSYVRSAILISIALIAVWLIRNRRVTLGFVLLAASLAAGVAFLVALSGASETHSVRTGPNTYVTLNGRTTVWGTIFSRPTKVPFGLGVATIGTAAERAQSGVIVDSNAAKKTAIAVDSGYFATVADVGIVGLLILLALFSRILALGAAATRRGDVAGWLVIGWMIVLLIDAVTRASFTGFPTAFLGMLFVGIGLAASPRRPGTGPLRPT